MKDRIIGALKKAGFDQLPTEDSESLQDYGLDSLTAALLISELEREFKIKISPDVIQEGKLENIIEVKKLIQSLGGK